MTKFLRVFVQSTMLGAAVLAFLASPIFMFVGGMATDMGTRQAFLIGFAIMMAPLFLGVAILVLRAWVLKRPQWHGTAANIMGCIIVTTLAYFGPGNVFEVLWRVIVFFICRGNCWSSSTSEFG